MFIEIRETNGQFNSKLPGTFDDRIHVVTGTEYAVVSSGGFDGRLVKFFSQGGVGNGGTTERKSYDGEKGEDRFKRFHSRI